MKLHTHIKCNNCKHKTMGEWKGLYCNASMQYLSENELNMHRDCYCYLPISEDEIILHLSKDEYNEFRKVINNE